MSNLSPKAMGLLIVLIVIGLVGSSCTAVPAMEMSAEMPAAPAAVMAETGAMPAIAGGGPDLAMQPTDQWMELATGEYHWYAFNFDFDEDYTQPVEVRLYSEPEDAAILTVRNAQQADLWRTEGEHEHFGCCTVQTFGQDDETPYAVWAGALESSGTYYIVVEHAKNLTDMANYRFEILGEGVSMAEGIPATSAMAPQPPAAAPVPVAETAPEAMVVMKGTGPDEAMTPTDAWVELGEGQYHWYAFTYDFDDDYTRPVEIQIFSEPADSAILTIRNTEQAALWRNEGEHEHFGCCTVQMDADDDETPYALWAGALESSGVYYIVVEHAKDVSGPVYYQFNLSGDGVSH